MKTIIITISSIIFFTSCSNDLSKRKFVCKEVGKTYVQIQYFDTIFKTGDSIKFGNKTLIIVR
jgi:hypothetical protein